MPPTCPVSVAAAADPPNGAEVVSEEKRVSTASAATKEDAGACACIAFSTLRMPAP